MRLRYERCGRGTPLVLIHGLGSARTIWKLVTPALAARYDVIAVDLPGHGETPWIPGTPMDPLALARHVRETLDECGVSRAHLVGNSLGGWTALELAAAHPARVASVTALAPGGMRERPLARVHPLFRINRYLAMATRPALPVLLRSERLRALGFARNSPIWRQWSIETCRDSALAMAGARGFDAALAGTLNRVAGCAARVPATIPLSVVFGDSDTILPAPDAQSQRHMPPHGWWLRWERCGHAVQLDHPERVVALIDATAAAARDAG